MLSVDVYDEYMFSCVCDKIMHYIYHLKIICYRKHLDPMKTNQI